MLVGKSDYLKARRIFSTRTTKVLVFSLISFETRVQQRIAGLFVAGNISGALECPSRAVRAYEKASLRRGSQSLSRSLTCQRRQAELSSISVAKGDSTVGVSTRNCRVRHLVKLASCALDSGSRVDLESFRTGVLRPYDHFPAIIEFAVSLHFGTSLK
jgi:hypothetical protein